MDSVTYLNIYIYGVLGFIAATIFGCFYFYSGMGATSFVVSTAAGQVTYYTDNSQYNLYLQGFIYCLTFAVAGFLLLTVMAIPNAEILTRHRAMATPSYTAPQPIVAPQAPPQMEAPQAPPTQMAAPQAPPQMEAPPTPPPPKDPTAETDLDEIIEEFEEMATEERPEEGDSDVVFGTGKVTEESMMNFIHRNPDSAIKFLYRKTLEGKPLPAADEEIYQNWQKRGLSRAWIREYILQLMEWQALPTDKTLTDIWSELRDQIFDMVH